MQYCAHVDDFKSRSLRRRLMFLLPMNLMMPSMLKIAGTSKFSVVY